MWLVRIYCEFQMFDEAKREALHFPKSADCTEGNQLAWIYWSEKNLDSEIKAHCENFANTLTSIEHELIMLGNAYRRKKMYKEAIGTYETFINITETVFGNRENTPPLNIWYWIYMNIAYCHLELGNTEKAIDCLEIEYEKYVAASKAYNANPDLDSIPTLKMCNYPTNKGKLKIKGILIASIYKKWFDSIRNHPRFMALTEKVNALYQ